MSRTGFAGAMRRRAAPACGNAAERSARRLPLLLLAALALSAGSAFAEDAVRPVSFYVDAALAGNPSLEAMAARIRMKESAAVRAGALDDPKIGLGINSVPIRSWDFREEDMTGKELRVSQMLPWPGMLRARADAALKEKEEATHLLEEMRNMLRSETRMTYAELASVRVQARTVRGSQDIVKDIVDVARESYAAGKGSQTDVLRGHVEYGRMREILIGLETREKVLSARLNTLSALPPDAPVPALAEPGEIPLPWNVRDLTAVYEAERPARKAALSRVRRGDDAVRMATLSGKPEFEVSVSYMQRDRMPDGTKRSDMLSSMVMMTLPIWRKEKVEPGIREMEAGKRMARQELSNLDLEASNQISRSLHTLESRLQAAVLYRTTLIPQAEQAFQATVASYRVGKADFPMLMDAATATLSFRREYAAMVGELLVEKARLEAVVGKPLD